MTTYTRGPRTLTTAQAAAACGVPAGSFHAWAHRRGVHELHRVRIGRSTVTVWDRDALARATAPDQDTDADE